MKSENGTSASGTNELKRPYVMRARAAAAEETAQRVIDATYRLLISDHYDDITLTRIADDAGVTSQTVLRRFGSKEGVLEAVFDATTTAVDGWRAETDEGSVDDVVATVMAQYEHDGDAVMRLLGIEERVSAVAEQMERGRRGHRDWLASMLADRLPARGVARKIALAKIVVATDLYTWKLCRRDLGLTVVQTSRVMTDLAHEALEPMEGKQT